MRDLEKERYLAGEFEKINIPLDDGQISMFITFYEMLVEKNKVMNLTAITEFEDVVKKHFIDSLMISRVFVPDDTVKGLDLGTGAGFPGIPLKIVYPSCRLTLVDSLNKRIRFLDDVIEKLGLSSVETVHSRAEDLARNEMYRESYDFCVSRAVAGLPVLSEYSLPFVRKGGHFIAYKSEKTGEEIEGSKKALAILGGRIERVDEFKLPDSDINRSLIIIKKEAVTSKKYPRKAGTPAREPL